ncbi:MAG: acyl-CoA thioesterase [Acidaminobacter sp.]|nr:acyl-CoA thioesterase [Acidaminobacter sp.]
MPKRIDNLRTLEVRISDINYGNHMGNDRALTFFQDARISFLQQLGYEERRIGDNVGIIVSEAQVKYRKEVFLHDLLDASVWVDELRDRSFVMHYAFIRQSDQACVFEGSTKIYAFDYQSRKAVRLPEAFRKSVGDDLSEV